MADTGALLAYLDRVDVWHERCRDAFSQFRLLLATSTAVLTELFHLVGDSAKESDVVWRFVRSGVLTVHAIDDREREGLATVFTIDNDDFETYRIGARKRFRILPGR